MARTGPASVPDGFQVAPLSVLLYTTPEAALAYSVVAAPPSSARPVSVSDAPMPVPGVQLVLPLLVVCTLVVVAAQRLLVLLGSNITAMIGTPGRFALAQPPPALIDLKRPLPVPA